MRWALGVLLIVAVGTGLALSVWTRPAVSGGTGAIARNKSTERQVLAENTVPNLATGDGARATEEFTDLNTIHADVTDWKFDAAFELPEIPEPSGLCYCALTGTIFVVDDGAADRPSGLYEIDLDGNYKRGVQFGTDLEAVTYCSANKLLYVADEKDETVHIVEPKELEVQGSFQVSREYAGKEVLQPGGNGFEGIAWLNWFDWCDAPEDGALLLANQDDPHALLAIWVSDIKTGETIEPFSLWQLPERNIGELYMNNDPDVGELWVVNSWMNTVGIVSAGDLMLGIGSAEPGAALAPLRWEVMPGMAQEGLTFDPQGRMWIGQDIGGVVRYVHTAKPLQ